MTRSLESDPVDARPLKRVYAVLFAAAISLPVLELAIEGGGHGAQREQRRSESYPRLRASWQSWESFPGRLDEWYADHFGFRETLVRQHNWLKWQGLATSPSENVVRGRGGWVFYADNDTLAQVRGAQPFEAGDVEAWVAMLEERRAWLAERGCAYLFAIAPVKPSIYPDRLPRGYERVGPSRLDELAVALAQQGSVRFLDLRAALLDERSNDRGGDLTYYPLGTHWTWRGALRAWREIVRALPELFSTGPPPLDELERVLEEDNQGDSWAERLYLEDQLRQEVWVLPLGPTPEARTLGFGRQGVQYEGGSQVGPRVMLMHDSFGSLLRPMLARSCRSLTCIWRHAWDTALLEDGRPDLVIDLFVERTLVTLDPASMPLPTQTRLRSQFEAAEEILWSVSGDELAGAEQLRLADGEYRTVRLPDLAGARREPCWIAVDIESDAGGVLELALHQLGARRPDPSRPRARAARAFAAPGRQTLYFTREVPPGESELLLGSEQGGWRILGAQARRMRDR